MPTVIHPVVALVLLAPAVASAQSSPPCVPDWQPTFGGPAGTSGQVRALAAYGAGAGRLVAGGVLTQAGGTGVSAVAEWVPPVWRPLGAGVGGEVDALLGASLGGEPVLVVGGSFQAAGGQPASNVARWDGQAWSALGAGLPARVQALCLFDSGSGEQLYAAGLTSDASGSWNSVWRFDGALWQPVATALGPAVIYDLCVWDDGQGPALYAAGIVPAVGLEGIARFDGNQWTGVGGGISGGAVYCLTVWQDGPTSCLVAGGAFTSAGPVPASRVARWDGSVWQAMGSGLSGGGSLSFVRDLGLYGDGMQSHLIAVGGFTQAGTGAVERVARYDGAAWVPLADGGGKGLGGGSFAQGIALCAFDDGGGPGLFVGGSFTTAGEVNTSNFALWRDGRWDAPARAPNAGVEALVRWDDGQGEALYAAGNFTGLGTVDATRVGRWDGSGWSPLGSGFNSNVYALVVHGDGQGQGLYAGGAFTSAGGISASRVARWDGAQWSPLGAGVGGIVYALASYKPPLASEALLIAAGNFTSAGGAAASRIAAWNGAQWSPLGSGVGVGGDPAVRALAVYEDGLFGPSLVVGGGFTQAGGQSANRIARWNGSQWFSLSTGCNSRVDALAVHDDGSGPALYAGGIFTTAGGQGAARIARWKDGAFTPLGTGMDDGVLGLVSHDDGTGPALFAAGRFSSAGGQSSPFVARWKGGQWLAAGTGLTGSATNSFATDLVPYGAPSDPNGSLYAAGTFTRAGADTSFHLARWGCPLPPAYPVALGCFGNAAKLLALNAMRLGSPFHLRVEGDLWQSGFALLYLGLPLSDAQGCGLLLPDSGELLLAPSPPPVWLASATTTAGIASIVLPVPNAPGLLGLELNLQAANIGFVGPIPSAELTPRLEVVVAP